MANLNQRGEKNPYWKGGPQKVAECAFCGEDIIDYRPRKFCSADCKYESFKRRAFVECVVCGEEFEVRVNELERGKGFCCSKKCSGQFYSDNYSGENHHCYGVEKTEEHKQKIGEAQLGEKNHQWKGGWSRYDEEARNSHEYKRWFRAVIKRDGCCQYCRKDHDLVAHHVHEFAKYPELRYYPENGLTLCRDCHHEQHYG